MRLTIHPFILLVCAAGASASAQDLTIITKVTHGDGPPETTISYMSTDHVRISQGDGRESILDLQRGRMTTLDGKKKTYYVTTKEDLDALAAKLQERRNSPEMKKAQEAMKNLPPEQQKQMKAAMGGMFEFHVQKTGTTRRIAGYPCENWTVTIGQFSTSEECLTTELAFPPQAWEMYRRFGESMKSLMAGLGPLAESASEMVEQFKKMKGYPLANTTTVDVMGHKSVTVSEVTEIKRGTIPASVWEIPPGYTKVEDPMQKALASRGAR